MEYPTYLIAVAELMPTTITDPDFLTILPRAIEYAENRCYGDLDMLATRITNNGGLLTANTRLFPLPTNLGTFIVVEQINVFAPAGSRVQLLPVAREFMDAAWPTNAAPFAPSVPRYYALYDQANVLVGPAPDAAYGAEVIGTIRPTPLSEDTPASPLTLFVPQLFLVATMVFMSAYMRDFAPASDDPQLPVTYEAQYKKLLTTALVEEFRKKVQGAAWTTRLPSPVATPPQT